jgi:MoxR-like ATPase
MLQSRFDSVEEVRDGLKFAGYLADDEIATVLWLADRLDRPLLVEGPAGSGKTELAKATAEALAMTLIRLQCYEGVDENKVLYEWNYKKQLLRIQAAEKQSWADMASDIFSEEFLLERPVLQAIRSQEPAVLLIDEVDKLDIEAEALLLEVLSDWQITIHELGTVAAKRVPFVILTSNNSRELTEALKRRCLYLYLDYPTLEREKEIITTKVPGIEADLAERVVKVVHSLRELELKKAPSIAETLDWARTLVHLEADKLDSETLRKTLSVVLKFKSDLERAAEHLAL